MEISNFFYKMTQTIFCKTIFNLFFTFLFIFYSYPQVNGQNKKDSIIHSNFGISFSLLTSKQKTTTFQPGLVLSDFKSTYSGLSPELSIWILTSKKNIAIKNEIAFTNILTKQSFSQYELGFVEPFSYRWVNNIQEYHYDLINYRLSIGYILKKLHVLIGIQTGYILRALFIQESTDPDMGDYQDDLKKDHAIPNFIYDFSVFIDYKISKKWFIGIKGFQQIYSKNAYPPSSHYYLNTFQFSLSRLILNKHKNS